MISGQVLLGQAFQITSVEMLADHYDRHRYPFPHLPYAKTWAHPVRGYREVQPPVAFVHPRGAVGIVKYRPRN